MMPLPHQHRHSCNPLAERRLCRFSPDVPPKGPPTLSDKLHDALQEVTKVFGKVVLNVSEFVGRLIIDVPSGLLKGILEAWNESAVKDSLVSILQKAADFCRDVPGMGSVIDRLSARPDLESWNRLVDQGQWITAFGDQQVLTAPVETPIVGRTFGPRELLCSLPLVERQRIFLMYLDNYIPRTVQDRYQQIFDPDPAKRVQELVSNPKKLQTATNALQGIVGLQDVQDDARGIAVGSLIEHYRPVPVDPSNPASPLIPPKALADDYKRTLHLHRFAGLHPVQTSPAELGRNLADLEQHNRFLGALKLEVIRQPVLEKLSENLQKIEHEDELVTSKTAQNIDTLRGQTREKLEKQATDAMDMWHGMQPWQKFLLIAGIGFMLVKSKVARAAALIFGVGYFGRMFLYKDPAPGRTMLGWGFQGFEKLREKNKEVFPWLMPEAEIDPYTHSELLVSFLKEYDRRALEIQATGLGLLMEMPLDLLAQNFDASGPNGSHWRLNIASRSTLDQAMGEAARKNGWRKDYKDFFCDPHALALVTEGMGYVFYSIGEKDPKMRQKDGPVDTVRRALGTLPEGSTPADFVTGKMQDPLRAYVSVVLHGRKMALKDRQTLGSYLREEMGLKRKVPEVSKPHELLPAFQAKAVELRKFNHPQGMFKILRLAGGTVEYDLDLIPKPSLARTSIEAFVKQNPHQIYSKYFDWHTKKPPAERAVNPDPFQ